MRSSIEPVGDEAVGKDRLARTGWQGPVGTLARGFFYDSGVTSAIEQRDTIVAIATAAGRGGIGVVRLAGPESRNISLPLLQMQGAMEAGRARFARIVDSSGKIDATGQVLDEAVVTFFAAPHSYTGDDVVEIAAHGSPVLLDWLLRACVERGARLARAGEFTERAFLSGRLDLTQAEAVRDLIEATTLEQARVAARQLGGALSREIAPVKQALVELIGGLEAGIDFAEDDIDVMPAAEIRARVAAVRGPLALMAESFAYGRVLREGVTLAIVGRPNAGKSSLFNRLVRRERAIVTAQPGTTRDLVTETMVLEDARGGVPIHLVDTAGLRAASDEAEAMGIAKSREALADADLALLVLDATAPLNAEEKYLLEDETLAPRLVIVRNKIDLRGIADAITAMPTSAITGEGVEELRAHLLKRVRGSAEIAATPVTNLRQQQAVVSAMEALAAADAALDEHVPHEMLLLDLYRALRSLDELTGDTTTEDILALIFSTFCIGK
jgi:tRNA modification GTPase